MSDCARALLLLHKSQNSGPVPKGAQVAGATTTLKKEMSNDDYSDSKRQAKAPAS
jgi:hypothetical protein